MNQDIKPQDDHEKKDANPFRGACTLSLTSFLSWLRYSQPADRLS